MAGTRAIKLQQAITKGEFDIPENQQDDEIEPFLDDQCYPKPHLCKDTFMTDEEKQTMKEKSTAKMREVMFRKF